VLEDFLGLQAPTPTPTATSYTYWDLGGCNCPAGCMTTVCVTTTCGTTVAVVGAVVTVLSGATVIDSGTTGGGGCVVLAIPSVGTYTVTIEVGGVVAYSGSQALLCGGTNTIAVASGSGIECCGSLAIPDELFLTDALGTLPLFLNPIFGPALVWTGCRILSLSAVTRTITPVDVCTPVGPAPNNVVICYFMRCSAGALILQRQVPLTTILSAGDWYYYSLTGNGTLPDCSALSTCPGVPTGIPYEHCPTSGNDLWQGSASATTNAPFTATFPTLTDLFANLADPVGGGVVVTQ